jgi:hypothetical protein
MSRGQGIELGAQALSRRAEAKLPKRQAPFAVVVIRISYRMFFEGLSVEAHL